MIGAMAGWNLKCCNERLLELTDAKVKFMNRVQWEDFVKGANGGMNV